MKRKKRRKIKNFTRESFSVPESQNHFLSSSENFFVGFPHTFFSARKVTRFEISRNIANSTNSEIVGTFRNRVPK